MQFYQKICITIIQLISVTSEYQSFQEYYVIPPPQNYVYNPPYLGNSGPLNFQSANIIPNPPPQYANSIVPGSQIPLQYIQSPQIPLQYITAPQIGITNVAGPQMHNLVSPPMTNLGGPQMPITQANFGIIVPYNQNQQQNFQTIPLMQPNYGLVLPFGMQQPSNALVPNYINYFPSNIQQYTISRMQPKIETKLLPNHGKENTENSQIYGKDIPDFLKPSLFSNLENKLKKLRQKDVKNLVSHSDGQKNLTKKTQEGHKKSMLPTFRKKLPKRQTWAPIYKKRIQSAAIENFQDFPFKSVPKLKTRSMKIVPTSKTVQIRKVSNTFKVKPINTSTPIIIIPTTPTYYNSSHSFGIKLKSERKVPGIMAQMENHNSIKTSTPPLNEENIQQLLYYMKKQMKKGTTGEQPKSQMKPLAHLNDNNNFQMKPLAHFNGNNNFQMNPLSHLSGNNKFQMKPLAHISVKNNFRINPLAHLSRNNNFQINPLAHLSGNNKFQMKPLSHLSVDNNFQMNPLAHLSVDNNFQIKPLSHLSVENNFQMKPLPHISDDNAGSSVPLTQSTTAPDYVKKLIEALNYRVPEHQLANKVVSQLQNIPHNIIVPYLPYKIPYYAPRSLNAPQFNYFGAGSPNTPMHTMPRVTYPEVKTPRFSGMHQSIAFGTHNSNFSSVSSPIQKKFRKISVIYPIKHTPKLKTMVQQLNINSSNEFAKQFFKNKMSEMLREQFTKNYRNPEIYDENNRPVSWCGCSRSCNDPIRGWRWDDFRKPYYRQLSLAAIYRCKWRKWIHDNVWYLRETFRNYFRKGRYGDPDDPDGGQWGQGGQGGGIGGGQHEKGPTTPKPTGVFDPGAMEPPRPTRYGETRQIPERGWTKSSHGKIPIGAFSAGKNKEGKQVYIGRAPFTWKNEKGLTPGMLVDDNDCLIINWRGLEHCIPEYEVLVGDEYTWVYTVGKNKHPDYVIAGYEYRVQEVLGICRIMIGPNLLVTKCSIRDGICYNPGNVLTGTKEIKMHKYELLVQ